jgi:hypothetical protein
VKHQIVDNIWSQLVVAREDEPRLRVVANNLLLLRSRNIVTVVDGPTSSTPAVNKDAAVPDRLTLC